MYFETTYMLSIVLCKASETFAYRHNANLRYNRVHEPIGELGECELATRSIMAANGPRTGATLVGHGFVQFGRKAT